jgi:uncharacterized protein (DUF58 family)
MFASFRQQFRTWLFRPQIAHGAITLTQRRIFIIPTRQGLAFMAVLALMLLGDINYNLSLGYALTFLLAMMAVLSMLYAFRNLAHLEIRAGRVSPVFSGETAQFRLHFHNHSALSRYQLGLVQTGTSFWSTAEASLTVDVPSKNECIIEFPLAATQRGWLPLGRLKLCTEFPLGLFHAWSYLHFDTRCLVYPQPLGDVPLPPGDAPDGTGRRNVAGDDDFSGLRRYVAGDALPRVAWKAYASGRGLQVKQFSTPAGEELWLDFFALYGGTLEEKLSYLTRWVLDAEAQGLRYGLRLPDSELPPGQGDVQRDACLRRIALFGLPHANEDIA